MIVNFLKNWYKYFNDKYQNRPEFKMKKELDLVTIEWVPERSMDFWLISQECGFFYRKCFNQIDLEMIKSQDKGEDHVSSNILINFKSKDGWFKNQYPLHNEKLKTDFENNFDFNKFENIIVKQLVITDEKYRLESVNKVIVKMV